MIGIYKIVNNKNAKIYVGQSKNIKNRIAGHKYSLRKNKHHIKPLQEDWNLYGEDVFSFEIIQECTVKELGKLEAHYIQQFDTTDPSKGYNKIKEVYVAADPIRGPRPKPHSYTGMHTEPEDHPQCIECEFDCKQYANADILYCPKMKRK